MQRPEHELQMPKLILAPQLKIFSKIFSDKSPAPGLLFPFMLEFSQRISSPKKKGQQHIHPHISLIYFEKCRIC